MKRPELGFGGSNSAYNLEKGPWPTYGARPDAPDQAHPLGAAAGARRVLRRSCSPGMGTPAPRVSAGPPRSAAVWSSIQGSPRFQKLARDRERGVRLSGDVPAEGTPPSGSAGRAKERRRAKRRCRWSSCCRPRAGQAPGAELGPPKPSPQTRGLLQHPHGIGPRGTAEAGERGQAPTPWLRAGTRG